MDQPLSPGTWRLEGTYSERDIRAFAAFLAGRVAGSKLWALGVFVLLPLLWSGDIRKTWPLMVPIACALAGFILLLRFRILPAKLCKSALRLPGVSSPRCITVDTEALTNTSEAGRITLRLEEVREVIATPEHLFVMVAAKQGIAIPRAWVGDEHRVEALTALLLSRRLGTA